MKTLITTVAAAIMATCSALGQTYFNIPLTPTSPSNSVVVPTNTVFHLLHIRATDPAGANGTPGPTGITQVIFNVDYPNLPTMPYVQADAPNFSLPVLGPATVNLQAGFHDASSAIMCLVKLESVNATPDLRGFAVQPAKSSATIALETSTNLTNWAPATNGTYSATNSARFFRMNLSVQP
jgi:hypothetical protein